MNVGIDIDGVLFPWADVVNELMVERFGLPDPGPHVHWEHLKETITPEQWAWLWSPRGQNAVFGQVERVYPGVTDALAAILRIKGVRVHFVTHRDPLLTSVHTARFLQRHFCGKPWAGVHVLQADIRKAELLPWDVFVDDKPETFRDLIYSTDAPLVCAPVRPWNEQDARLLRDNPRFLHYGDPTALVDAIKATRARQGDPCWACRKPLGRKRQAPRDLCGACACTPGADR